MVWVTCWSFPYIQATYMYICMKVYGLWVLWGTMELFGALQKEYLYRKPPNPESCSFNTSGQPHVGGYTWSRHPTFLLQKPQCKKFAEGLVQVYISPSPGVKIWVNITPGLRVSTITEQLEKAFKLWNTALLGKSVHSKAVKSKKTKSRYLPSNGISFFILFFFE